MGRAESGRAKRAARREAFERRVFRLALLLTGSAEGASRTLDAVARSARDLSRVDAVHLDRLTVLHAREAVARGKSKHDKEADAIEGEPEGAAAETMRALMEMKPQPREAWVLTRVDGLDELHVARAMDASKTASGQHLRAAEAFLGERLEDAEGGTGALRAWSEAYDPDAWLIMHRDRKRARRRLRWGLVVAAVVVLGLVAVGAVVLL